MVSPARAIALVAALSTAAPFVPAIARAQVGAAASPAEGTVSVRIVGPDDPALKDSIRELLARLRLVMSAGGPGEPGTPSTLARVEIDLTSTTDALLLVSSGATGEVRFRRAVPRDTTAAIVREEIAHAVQSAVESELLSARDRAAQPPLPAPAPPPPAPPIVVVPPTPEPIKEQPSPRSGPSPFGLELTTLAGVGPVANGSGPVTRIGLGAVGMSHGALHPSVGLSLLYAVPFDTGTLELSSHASIASVRILPAIEILHARWLAVDLGVGGGVDVLTVAPRSGNLPVSNLGEQTTRADGVLSAMATAHVALAPGVVVFLSAGIDVDLDSRRYVLAQGPSDADVLVPWRVRPMLLAGFGFMALGDGHFASGGGR